MPYYRCQVIITTDAHATVEAENLDEARRAFADGDYYDLHNEEIVDMDFLLETVEEEG